MIGFIIAGHGSFAAGMKDSVELITGEMNQVACVEFRNDQSRLENELEKAMTELDTGEGIICFTDLAGGTPFNVCSRLATNKEKIKVLGGINSPMLLHASFKREEPVEDSVQEIMEEGRTNIKAFGELSQKNRNETEGL